MKALAHQVPAASQVLEHIGALISRCNRPSPGAASSREYVRLGPSPRGAQALTYRRSRDGAAGRTP